MIREIGTLNKRIAGRTNVEYRQQNADKINKRQKAYRQRKKAIESATTESNTLE